MPMQDKRYWTSYWKKRNWRVNPPYVALSASGGWFKQRPIEEGHIVYIVSMNAGQLLLGGRLEVGRLVSRLEAVRLLKRDNLYDAQDWIIAKTGSGTALHHDRRLAPEVSRQLQFLPGRAELLFTNHSELDRQTLRTPRELTLESARLLDRIIQKTESHRHPIIITTDDLRW